MFAAISRVAVTDKAARSSYHAVISLDTVRFLGSAVIKESTGRCVKNAINC